MAMKDHNPKFDNSGIQMKHLKSLHQQWEETYPDLTKKKPKPDYDSGRIWAALFIVSCIKNVVNNKKLNDQDVAYNWKAKEKKDKELKEAQERKDKILAEIKLQKKLKKQEKASGKLGIIRSRSVLNVSEARRKMKGEPEKQQLSILSI